MQFVDLRRQHQQYQSEIEEAIKRVIASAQFINGPEVFELEKILGAYVGREAIGVGSGTEALQIALMALRIGPGDEVITTPFTWVSTAEAIALVGAKPVFVDIEKETFNIDPKKIEASITSKTKAIIPVSLFGQMASYQAINRIALAKEIPVIEDGAQSFGAEQGGEKSCGVTPIAITSFFPAKPLGCYGDGGAIFVQDKELADEMRAIRNHGSIAPYKHTFVGMTGRLDTIQAAILLAKWPGFEKELEERKELAAKYNEALNTYCQIPFTAPHNSHIYAQYTIRTAYRDELIKSMKGAKVPYGIYYPMPLYKQPIFNHLSCQLEDFPNTEEACKEVISLPLHPWLTEEEQEKVMAVVRQVCAT